VTAMVPLLKLRLSASSKPLCFRISTSSIVSTEWWEFSNLQTSWALDYELRVWLKMLGFGTQYVNADWRSSTRSEDGWKQKIG
jgi:hypothetical protein